jgi:hypothetical protein
MLRGLLRGLLRGMLHWVLRGLLRWVLRWMLRGMLRGLLRGLLRGMLHWVLRGLLRWVLRWMLRGVLRGLLRGLLRGMLRKWSFLKSCQHEQGTHVNKHRPRGAMRRGRLPQHEAAVRPHPAERTPRIRRAAPPAQSQVRGVHQRRDRHVVVRNARVR